MNTWIVYYSNNGRLAKHNYVASEAKVRMFCANNPGLTYMAGSCHADNCKVNVNVTPHVVEHNVNKPPVSAYIRTKRNIFLKDCDWTVGVDSPLSDSKKAEWQTYRQQLRDLMDTYADETDQNNVVWPTPPA